MTTIYLLDARDLYPIKSYFVIIYDANLNALKEYQAPVSTAAPFTNRLFRELPEMRNLNLHEPWYSLAHMDGVDFTRSPHPLGPTSIYSQPYDPAGLPSPAIQIHPDAAVRYFDVRLYDCRTELYKGVYTVDDIFLHGAHHVLCEGIKRGQAPSDRGPYYYAIYPSRMAMRDVPAEVLPEDAYNVEGVFHLPPRKKDEKRIIFKPVPEPPPPERDPDALGPARPHGKGPPGAGRVFIPNRVYKDLHHRLKFNNAIEEGGYLLGNVYRLPGVPGEEENPEFRWVVEATDLLMAEDTVGSPATLLFTGDSWSKISRQIDRDYAHRKLVGWFHTHIFPATDDFGLSGLDQDMHAWYLPRPWQVAILLNLEKDGGRTVRCYQKGEDGWLEESMFQVTGIDEAVSKIED